MAPNALFFRRRSAADTGAAETSVARARFAMTNGNPWCKLPSVERVLRSDVVSETRLRGFFPDRNGSEDGQGDARPGAQPRREIRAKSGSWDQNKTFLPGDQLRAEVVPSGQLALAQ
jgi:hypothetical protein